MYKHTFIIILSALFIFSNQARSQNISEDKAVLNPLVDINKLSEYKDSRILRKYMPFDDVTLFTTIFGGQVYDSPELRINMFPIALTKGDVHKVNPQNTSLALQFSFHSDSTNSSSNSFQPQTITFLIDDERYREDILKNDAVFFEKNSTYIKLIRADSVRARIEGINKNHEIDMTKEIRSILGVLLIDITPNQDK